MRNNNTVLEEQLYEQIEKSFDIGYSNEFLFKEFDRLMKMSKKIAKNFHANENLGNEIGVSVLSVYIFIEVAKGGNNFEDLYQILFFIIQIFSIYDA